MCDIVPILADVEERFGVVIRPSGLRTFILVYRNPQGRVCRLTIGRYGRLTVEPERRGQLTDVLRILPH